MYELKLNTVVCVLLQKSILFSSLCVLCMEVGSIIMLVLLNRIDLIKFFMVFYLNFAILPLYDFVISFDYTVAVIDPIHH